VDYSTDTTAPGVPYLSYLPGNALVINDFENYLGEFCSRRKGSADPDVYHKATGDYGLRLGGFSTFARYTPFDAGKYPMLRFDYKMNPKSSFNLILRIATSSWEIVCNYPGKTKANRLGKLPGIKADGRWHRAEFDLEKFLKLRTDPDESKLVEHVATYYWRRHGMWIDNFSIAPRIDLNPRFQWSVPDDRTGIKGYSFHLDDKAQTIPDESIDTIIPFCSFKKLQPGSYFLHVRACDGAGNWGDAGHLGIKISAEEQ